MEYKATAKYVRTSTRKVRLAADAIRGKSADRALIILELMHKAAAEPLKKVLLSALSNAKKTQKEADTLSLKQVEVMGGPVMKRFHAVSRGMAHGYKKRMTHIRVVLGDKGEK